MCKGHQLDDERPLLASTVHKGTQLQKLAITVLVNTRNYFTSLNLALNIDKTVIMQFGNSQENPQIEISIMTLEISEVARFLGMEIDKNLNWSAHINKLEAKLSCSIFVLSQLSHSINQTELKQSYYAFFHSHLSYGTILWAHNITLFNLHRIFKLQKTGIRQP